MVSKIDNTAQPSVRPFVKWAGGKGQLLNEIQKTYTVGLGTMFTKYAEPFVGGGAVLCDVLNSYSLKDIYISDINRELITAYTVIRDAVKNLISFLEKLQQEYIPLRMEQRKKYFYEKRFRFNFLKINGWNSNSLEGAALFIFLNKTCFNGLYRVNQKGLYNVPMGDYRNPKICDEENLQKLSLKLRNVAIVHADYKKSEDFIDKNTFVYIDPPYRPIAKTANFTAYTETLFDDASQKELADFVDRIGKKGAKVVVSNSDPKNFDADDSFFDDLYMGHRICRIAASRMINSDSTARGKINELLITNF